MYCDLCHFKIIPSKILKEGFCPLCGRIINMSNHNTLDRDSNPFDQYSIWELAETLEASMINKQFPKITEAEIKWVSEMHVTEFGIMWDTHNS